jgi:hypothetical protein
MSKLIADWPDIVEDNDNALHVVYECGEIYYAFEEGSGPTEEELSLQWI